MTASRTVIPLLLTALVACGQPAQATVSLARNVAVGAFEALEVGGAWTVDLAVGRARQLMIRADDPRDLARVDARVAGGVLRLGMKGGGRSHSDLFASIVVPRVKHVTIAGACALEAAGFAGGPLTLSLAGASSAKLAGRVDRLSVDLAGACSLDAEKLVARDVTVDGSGACSAVVHAQKTLKVEVAGMCSVEYLGDPKVETAGAWMSSVKKRR